VWHSGAPKYTAILIITAVQVPEKTCIHKLILRAPLAFFFSLVFNPRPQCIEALELPQNGHFAEGDTTKNGINEYRVENVMKPIKLDIFGFERLRQIQTSNLRIILVL
jgi:hypothetical protein